MSNFVQKLADASRRNCSLLCVGLDPDPELMAVDDIAEFNKAIVNATKDLVCAYKPNLAFYEAQGVPGLRALEDSISHIRSNAPNVLILGDAKRGDIASTNVFYAKALFEAWEFDAVTVNAYAGGESLEPFFDFKDRGVFVFCRSSNPGAKEFQDLRLASDAENEGMTLYQHVAEMVNRWNTFGNVGIVAGATYPQETVDLRDRSAGVPFLIPGVGAQGGGLEDAVKAGLDKEFHNILISSSRGVTYASKDKSDFADAARAAASNLRDAINVILDGEGRGWS